MKLKLVRNVYRPKFIVGMLSLNDSFQCFTLEGDNKLPAGEYKVVVKDSKMTINDQNLESYLQLGTTVNPITGFVNHSKTANDSLLKKLNAVVDLEIKDTK